MNRVRQQEILLELLAYSVTSLSPTGKWPSSALMAGCFWTRTTIQEDAETHELIWGDAGSYVTAQEIFAAIRKALEGFSC